MLGYWKLQNWVTTFCSAPSLMPSIVPVKESLKRHLHSCSQANAWLNQAVTSASFQYVQSIVHPSTKLEQQIWCSCWVLWRERWVCKSICLEPAMERRVFSKYLTRHTNPEDTQTEDLISQHVDNDLRSYELVTKLCHKTCQKLWHLVAMIPKSMSKWKLDVAIPFVNRLTYCCREGQPT